LAFISSSSFLAVSSLILLLTSSSIKSSIPFSPAAPAARPTAAPISSGCSSFFFSKPSISFLRWASFSWSSFSISSNLSLSISISFLIYAIWSLVDYQP
jgi:hypothetical protein